MESEMIKVDDVRWPPRSETVSGNIMISREAAIESAEKRRNPHIEPAWNHAANDIAAALRALPSVAPSVSEEIKKLKSQLISGFYEDQFPVYTQGEPNHELQELVTASECNGLVDKIKLLSEPVVTEEQIHNANDLAVAAYFKTLDSDKLINTNDLIHAATQAFGIALGLEIRCIDDL